MPVDEMNISYWLNQTEFPIRGIISGRGGPTERLAGLIDHFLQPGMQQLDTFLKDTKHTLQLIEDTNGQIERGEFSLDGVALVTMDIENMYNNISEDLGMKAVKKYLDSRQYQGRINFVNMDPELSTKSLEQWVQE